MITSDLCWILVPIHSSSTKNRWTNRQTFFQQKMTEGKNTSISHPKFLQTDADKILSFSVWKIIFLFTSRWFVPSHNQGFSETWVYLQQYSYLASIVNFHFKVGPLPVINVVITPISRDITPVTHLSHKPIFLGPCNSTYNWWRGPPCFQLQVSRLLSRCPPPVPWPTRRWGWLSGVPKMIRNFFLGKIQPQKWPEEKTCQNDLKWLDSGHCFIFGFLLEGVHVRDIQPLRCSQNPWLQKWNPAMPKTRQLESRGKR